MQPVSIGEETIGLMDAISGLSAQLASFQEYMQTLFFKYLFAYLFTAFVFAVFLGFYMFVMYRILRRGS